MTKIYLTIHCSEDSEIKPTTPNDIVKGIVDYDTLHDVLNRYYREFISECMIRHDLNLEQAEHLARSKHSIIMQGINDLLDKYRDLYRYTGMVEDEDDYDDEYDE